MGSQNSTTSQLSEEQLQHLTLAMPLNTHSSQLTEVHEIISHSPEHHRVILDTIRAKKNYDCPYLVRILDSHTIQAQNMCSTVIKTYVVIEKPQSLQQEIEYRIENQVGFDEKELWTIMYSCARGALYLHQQSVSFSRLNPNKIYIDFRGDVKVADPELAACNSHSDNEHEVVSEIGFIVSSLMDLNQQPYSPVLSTALKMCKDPEMTLLKLISWIDQEHLQGSSTCPVSSRRQSFSTSKTYTNMSKSKRVLQVVSSSKRSAEVRGPKTLRLNRSRKHSMSQSINSFRTENKENHKENDYEYSESICSEAVKENRRAAAKDDSIDHSFPRKALFSQRRRRQCMGNPLKELRIEGSEFLNVGGEESLPGKVRMISYKVDHETSVCEMSSEHSEYLAELLNRSSQGLEPAE